MTQYGFFFDQTRCYGCQACATSCKSWNGLKPGPEKWMTVYEWETGVFPRIRLHELAFSCGHCESPTCVAACPEGAIFKEGEFGAVLVDRDKCVGCRKCAEACEYGAPKFASDEPGTKMSKCTMCVDKLVKGEKPECTLACPMRAFDFGPIDELVAKYGDIRTVEGFPQTDNQPAYAFKPMREKKCIIPFPDEKIVALNRQRGELPNLFDSEEAVTAIPEGLVARNGLKMKHESMADLMRYTRNDLG